MHIEIAATGLERGIALTPLADQEAGMRDSAALFLASATSIGARCRDPKAGHWRQDSSCLARVMDSPRDDEVTDLLAAWKAGDDAALTKLTPIVYSEIRRLAARHLRGERQQHSMQPTDLANETFMRLLGTRQVGWQDRAHFFAVASRLTRRVLVEHARKRKAAKRGGGATQVTLNDTNAPTRAAVDVDVLALHAALERLEELDPRQAHIIELRYFGGLSTDEIAATLDISPATVQRDWRVGKLWLKRALSEWPPS